MAQEKKHDSAALARIAQARHHYDTRSERRPKGQFAEGLFDRTVYWPTGGVVYRRPPSETLTLRQKLSGAVRLPLDPTLD